ncbi:MAG: glycosyltransferase family 2 protein [Ilumatobacteraceae bacterium]|nr:glycosyltransferase family 2 protein [Ilumatobacteraceae bacterium]
MVPHVAPRITFAMPFYRGLDHLVSALSSVLAQTIPDWEAIVVDDAGPESAEAVVAGFNDPRIRYVRNETNLGLAGNWNTALSLATTELVTIFHCDDELEPHYAATMIDLMARHPNAVAGHCRVRLIDESGQPTRTLADTVKAWLTPRFRGDLETTGDRGLRSLVRANWIFCPTVCYRRALVPAAPFDKRWRFVLDLDVMRRFLFDGHVIVGTDAVAYRYRRHADNQTKLLGADFSRHDEELSFAAEVAEQAKQQGWSATARTARRAPVVRANLLTEAASALFKRDGRRFRGALRRAVRGLPSSR